MNTKDKFCILFNLDADAQERIGAIHRQIKFHYPSLVSNMPERGDLPYHMTIIGGISLDKDDSTKVIKRAVKDILPFTDPAKIPTLWRIETCELNGNILGIRLVFAKGTYTITGDPYKNLAICKQLGVTNFKFDAVRHVSVCKVSGGFHEMDQVSSKFMELLSWDKPDIGNIRLTPEVWKNDGTGWKNFWLNL